jgi:hypothetical protein
MNLKNYTSTVPAAKSINRIEEFLVASGASDISKKFKEGACVAITFRMVIDNIPVFFQLPAKVDACFSVLWGEVSRKSRANKDNYLEQAERTAWKLVYDWVEMQFTMIKLNQVEALQVFLPYVYDPAKDETFYEKVKQSNLKLLTN